MHTCSHLIHTVQFVCVHCSSLTHINTHTHLHTYKCLFGCTFQSLLLKDKRNLPPVCPEGRRPDLVFSLCRKKEGSNSNTVLPAAPCTR